MGATASPAPNGPRTRTRRKDCFVLTKIPSTTSIHDLLPRLARSNASRLQISEATLMSHLRSAERLQRRSSGEGNVGAWIPSTSIRVFADPGVVDSVLRLGLLVLDFQTHSVRAFDMPIFRCTHCGKTGHTAKYCRGLCHQCNARHATAPCPLAQRSESRPQRQHGRNVERDNVRSTGDDEEHQRNLDETGTHRSDQ